jgi:hypothetical protein
MTLSNESKPYVSRREFLPMMKAPDTHGCSGEIKEP